MKPDGTVTLKQFHDWFEANKHHTWSFPQGWEEGGTHLVKYFDLSFDSRTSNIYYIKCRGLSWPIEAHVMDCVDNETILNVLDRKIAEALLKADENGEA